MRVDEFLWEPVIEGYFAVGIDFHGLFMGRRGEIPQKVGKLKDEIWISYHHFRLFRGQIPPWINGLTLLGIGIAHYKNGFARLLPKLHVPRKVMPFLSPGHITGIKEMA